MKSLIYFAGFGLMIWALIEQTREKPNIYIQIVAVVIFFFMMRNLMNKTPSNFDQNNENNEESRD